MKKNINDYPVWTAVVTPMNEDSSVDYESLEKLLREQEAAKNAVVVVGSTGEALNLSKSEMKKILDLTMKLNLSVPIMTGVGSFNLEETKEYLAYLETLPLDAYLMVTPIYAKPGEHGQTHWFKSLLDMSTKPCMLYNVPSRTGVKLNFNAVKKLAQHKNFWAIKEASGSVEDFKLYGEMNPHARMYSGDDGMVDDFRPYHCQGLVSVASNTWPTETHLYVELALKQQLTPSEIQLWKDACDTLFIASNPIPVKNLLFNQKKIKTKIMRAPLHHGDLLDNSPLIDADIKIKHWMREKV
jgi:4-hydroxy-tetrahydrodipicolinate synthase